MEKKIIELADGDRSSQLTQLLGQLKEKEIKEVLERCMLRGKSDPFALISAIFKGSAVTLKDGVQRRLIVYRHCLTLLQRNEMNPKTASSLVGLLMMEADTLPGSCLVELSNMFLDAVKNEKAHGGKAWDLFPKLLSVISVHDTINFDENTLKGSEYKSQVLNSLCSSRWSSKSVIPLAAMFRDMSLTTEELKFVIEKVVRSFNDLDLQDVPALVYQLSMLSAKGHKRLVLEGISEFFMEQDKPFHGRTEVESMDLLDSESENVDILRQTEGTVILHITFSIKQDQELGKEYLKYLKSSQQNTSSSLSPFILALSLSIARIQRFEDQVFDFIKSTIIKFFKDKNRHKSSQFIREMTSDNHSIEKQVLETVQNSKFGWDHVIQGLVDLGFTLMDAFGPKAAFGRVDNLPVHQSGPNHDACQLGAKILIDTFKAHESVRIEILDQIFNRVVTKATSPVTHYLELLSNTVISAPQILLESVPKVRETFDYLSMLPVTSAVRLMKAIQPLLKFSISLKDSLIIVLRKAMFSRQVDARKIGVSGFLMILRHFKVLGGLPSSQGSQSFSSSQIQVHCSHNPGSNEALCLEILGNLRRCLTQQADVRLTLYEGLYDVLCRNSQLGGPILDILYTQLTKYYESSEEVNPPLKLSSCIIAHGEQVYLAEPLGHLLSCIHHCILKVREFRKDPSTSDFDDEDDDSVSLTTLGEIVDSLTTRMIKSEMEDFELDKSADFSLSSSVGVRNNIFAILLMGTYEVLMEHTFSMGDYSSESCEQVIELHENYKKISDVLRQKAAAGGGKKGKAPANKPAISLLSVGFLKSVVQVVLQDTLPQHQEGVDHLKSSSDFIKYILQVTHQKIQQLQSKDTCDGIEGGDKNKMFQYISILGRVLLKYYVENHSVNTDRPEKKKNILALCLECLQGIFTYVCNNIPGQLDQFLLSLESNGDLDQRDEQKNIYTYIRKFQKLVVSILSGSDSDEEDVNIKEVVSLLNIIGLLGKFLLPENPHYEKLQNWTQKLCTEKNIDDLAVCKQLLQMLLMTTRQLKSCLPILRDFSQDIHCKAGDIDEDVELEDKTHFELVTIRSSTPTVLLVVLHALSEEMDDTEWGVNRLRADLQINAKDIVDCSQALTQRENYEKFVCIRLGMTINCFHELVQCVIPVGTCVETMFKEVTKLYGILTLLVKFYLTMYTLKAGHLTARFEKLVKLSGTHLTQKVYCMINYMQNTESEAFQQNVDKVKKDKKKISAVVQAGKAKVLKQTRLIPNLIFAIEQYERYLIQLTKKSKVNLMEHIKLSTSRDFRINAEALKRLDNGSSSEESSDDNAESGSNDSDNEQENEPPTQETQRPSESTKENPVEQPTAKRRKMALGCKSKTK